jgi:hypothetical protein
VLKTVVRELVQTGAYKDEQTALKAIAVEQASKKIAEYRRTIKRLQRKYKVKELEDLTHKMKDQASFQQEDDWLEWKAALEMLQGWEKALRELTNGEG